jgi:hypothetical protein
MRWTTRQIEAPANDTLTAAEVAVHLSRRDRKSVLRLVELGRFPEPIREDGAAYWLWEDVVWYLWSRRLRGRLRPPPPNSPPSEETPDPDPKPPPKRGRRFPNPGSGGILEDSAGSAEQGR